jgi:hypothetical protein
MTTEDPAFPPPPASRRRPAVGVSGWLLFVCLFLPTLRVCSSPSAPIEFPPCYVVYLGAIAIAAAALSSSLRTRRTAHATLLGLWFATGFGIFALWVGVDGSPAVGWCLAIVGLLLTIAVIRQLARAEWSERGMIGGWIAHALVASGWNTLLASDHDAMWGAYVALGASGTMLVASAIALSSENARRKDGDPDTPPGLPRARAID